MQRAVSRRQTKVDSARLRAFLICESRTALRTVAFALSQGFLKKY